MRRILLTIQYLGKNYNGFQIQLKEPNRTVQGLLEVALEQVLGEKTKIFSSGRLDKGVHANALKAHFDTEKAVASHKLCMSINHFLPEDISVISAEEVDLKFHARYSVKRKTYQYAMYVSPLRLPLLDQCFKQLYKQPDITLMREASKYLLGEHNFASFMSKKSGVKNTIRTIEKLEIQEQDNQILITVSGNGFLYNMVRIMVGTLLNVGYQKLKPEEIKTILESESRQKASKMVEANGLTLLHVEY